MVYISIALYTHIHTSHIKHTKYFFRVGSSISRPWVKLERKSFYLGGEPRSTHRGKGTCRQEESSQGELMGKLPLWEKAQSCWEPQENCSEHNLELPHQWVRNPKYLFTNSQSLLAVGCPQGYELTDTWGLLCIFLNP